MIPNKTIIPVLFLITFFTLSSTLEGPNVCKFEEPYNATERIGEVLPFNVKEYVWCFNVPPKCSRYKIEYRTEFKTNSITKTRMVEKCCEGYVADGDRCVAK